jgi:hypothetical protein
LKAIKGKGLCKLMVNGNSIDGIISISVGEPLDDLEWYRDIIFYLRSIQFHATMSSKERRKLKMKVNQYVLITGILFRRHFDGILLRCVDENHAPTMIKEFHEGICSEHFAPTATAQKITKTIFYWSSIFRDSYATIKRCLSC